MNCEEFREKIKSDSDITDNLIEHKNSCKECQNWLMNELNTAPQGINNDQWQKLISKHLPIVENSNLPNDESEKSEAKSETESESESDSKDNNTNEPQKEKSMLDSYFSGLKYGIVFGLSLVVGFSIVQNSQNTQNTDQNTDQNTTNIKSIATDTANIASDSVKPIDINASGAIIVK